LENWPTAYTDTDPPLKLYLITFPDGSAEISILENHGAQEGEWCIIPALDGDWKRMRLKATKTITGRNIHHWCHCLTGGFDHGYYPNLASLLFSSELLIQALRNSKSTLLWAEMNYSWQQFTGPITQCHLPASQGIYDVSQDEVDFRLILRESASRAKTTASF